MYLFILRHTVLGNGEISMRIGKKAIAARFAKGARGGDRSNYEHISNTLKLLEEKGCLKIGDTTREGTFYTLVLPRSVAPVAAKLAVPASAAVAEDYFTNDKKRQELFERDKWMCQYCGERVAKVNATLDHYVPQSKGGLHSKENLRTACLLCNSVKSGHTYEEAAPLILSSFRERNAKRNEASS